ncbi:hypothetical protein [Streptomyces sp. enrichment culture]|uniref:hypothetical protein n=1 Tax=Streptomyces sp. enrichment culture TaxID=1795815 RepID=UPI003F56F8F7
MARRITQALLVSAPAVGAPLLAPARSSAAASVRPAPYATDAHLPLDEHDYCDGR